MDFARFETQLRSLSKAPSRRLAVRNLAGLAMAGLLGGNPSEAKKHKKKHKKPSPPAVTTSRVYRRLHRQDLRR